MPPLLVRVPEAARLCGVSRSTFYDWSRRGIVEIVKIAGQGAGMVRYADLEKLVAEAVPA